MAAREACATKFPPGEQGVHEENTRPSRQNQYRVVGTTKPVFFLIGNNIRGKTLKREIMNRIECAKDSTKSKARTEQYSA